MLHAPGLLDANGPDPLEVGFIPRRQPLCGPEKSTLIKVRVPDFLAGQCVSGRVDPDKEFDDLAEVSLDLDDLKQIFLNPGLLFVLAQQGPGHILWSAFGAGELKGNRE